MNGRIFLLDGGDLRPIDEQPYDSEDLLQRLLADHPDLLAGDQIDDTIGGSGVDRGTDAEGG